MTEFKYFLLIAFFSVLGLLMCIFGSGCSPTPKEIKDNNIEIAKSCEDRCKEVGAKSFIYSLENRWCSCSSDIRYRILQ